MRTTLITLLLALCCLPGLAGQRIPDGLPPVDFDQDTLSLPPAYFPELPPQLATWLEQRSYRIPQVHDKRTSIFWHGCFLKFDKYNVLSGDFNGVGEQDWVAVTFREDTLKAFIYWDSDTVSVDLLDISEFYPEYGGYTSGGGRNTDVTSFDIILAKVHKEWLNDVSLGGPHKVHGDEIELPTSFDHDGFVFESDGDMWVAGYVRYYHNGEWIRFNHYGTAIATKDTLCLQEKYGPRRR